MRRVDWRWVQHGRRVAGTQILRLASRRSGKSAGGAPPNYNRRACHQDFTILTIIAQCAGSPLAQARYRVCLRFFSGPTYGVMPACK